MLKIQRKLNVAACVYAKEGDSFYVRRWQLLEVYEALEQIVENTWINLLFIIASVHNRSLDIKCGKEPTRQWRKSWEVGLTLGLGRSPGVGNGNPLQYSCLNTGKSWTEQPGRLQSVGSQSRIQLSIEAQ